LEKPKKTLGENVLARVLLHVVKPPRPVDTSSDSIGVDAFLEEVDDPAAVFENMDHGCSSEEAAVRRLAARLRVKAGLVEDDSRFSLKKKLIHDRRFKVSLVGILKIEPSRISLF
jgi:hypothetical protein